MKTTLKVVAVPTRVVTATRSQLEAFKRNELLRYAQNMAQSIGEGNWKSMFYWNRDQLVDWLLKHNATLCASLGT